MDFHKKFLIQITLFFCFSIICAEALRCYQCGSEAIFINYDEKSPPLSKSRIEELENTALTIESCSNLEYSGSSSSWGLYTVDCGPNQICTKTVRDAGFDEYGGHHYVTASRGCAMRNTSFGNFHSLTCGVLRTNNVQPPLPLAPADAIPKKWDLVCFCETDYCNGSVEAWKISWVWSLMYSVINFTLFYV